MSDFSSLHVPVLAREVIDWLDPQPGQTFVDATLGGGGHTAELAARVGRQGLIVALDRDPAALSAAQSKLAGRPVKMVMANFCDLPEVLAQLNIEQVEGVLMDLGISSDQLADQERGFSFNTRGTLDLRFNPAEGEPAWRLVHRLRERELADLIYQNGEERYSRRIARKIVTQRRQQPIRTAAELAELIRRCVPGGVRRGRIDPATRTFQALRIAVNQELSSLETSLQRIPDILRPGGRVAVISFHSLEDRPVKTAFRDDPRYEVLTKKPIRPTPEEVQRNPRSRSARLRVARRALE